MQAVDVGALGVKALKELIAAHGLEHRDILVMTDLRERARGALAAAAERTAAAADSALAAVEGEEGEDAKLEALRVHVLGLDDRFNSLLVEWAAASRVEEAPFRLAEEASKAKAAEAAAKEGTTAAEGQPVAVGASAAVEGWLPANVAAAVPGHKWRCEECAKPFKQVQILLR